MKFVTKIVQSKDLKFQMKEQHSEKLIEQFVEPYRVKKIISTNVIELELLGSVVISYLDYV